MARVDPAYEAFVRDASPTLLRAAQALCGDPHLAQDLVQETHVRLARAWERIDREADPMPYARTVLYRLWIDAWRFRRRRPEVLAATTPEREQTDPACAVVDRIRVRAVLARLTRRQQALLVLRFFEDRTEVQTADTLGISVSSVKSQTRAALERMRALDPALVARDDDPSTTARGGFR